MFMQGRMGRLHGSRNEVMIVGLAPGLLGRQLF